MCSNFFIEPKISADYKKRDEERKIKKNEKKSKTSRSVCLSQANWLKDKWILTSVCWSAEKRVTGPERLL
jgi:hypothetical protein